MFIAIICLRKCSTMAHACSRSGSAHDKPHAVPREAPPAVVDQLLIHEELCLALPSWPPNVHAMDLCLALSACGLGLALRPGLLGSWACQVLPSCSGHQCNLLQPRTPGHSQHYDGEHHQHDWPPSTEGQPIISPEAWNRSAENLCHWTNAANDNDLRVPFAVPGGTSSWPRPVITPSPWHPRLLHATLVSSSLPVWWNGEMKA